MKYISKSYAHAACVFAFMAITAGTTGCTSDGDLVSEPGPVTCLRFTEEGGSEGEPEYIRASYISQTLELRVISTTYETVPFPQNLDYLYIREWDESREVFDTPGWDDVNQPDDFYHVSIDKDKNGPVLKIELKENDTDSERKVLICPGDFSNSQLKTVGAIELIQNPDYSKTEPFIVKAKYKDNIYESIAQLDSVGNLIYMNQEYKQLMLDIDTNPTSSLVVMSDSILHYYDGDDIASNKIYDDLKHLKQMSDSQESNDILNTRSTGFENLESGDLGYMAIYDNDHFKGKMLFRGLANFHFAYTLPNLKQYDINDKVTSIAVAYNGSNPSVCSVLTIWEDTNFNYGDKNRKKHRISIIASEDNPRVTCPDLKKIKKIGSSKSWNDCISSISFHFGYVDSTLLDY